MQNKTWVILRINWIHIMKLEINLENSVDFDVFWQEIILFVIDSNAKVFIIHVCFQFYKH